MTAAFWIKRALLAFTLSFAVIGGAQYLKTKDPSYALTQAAIWGTVSTVIYLVVLRRKLKQNPACAIEQQTSHGSR